MIDANNLDQFKVELQDVDIFPIDVEYIVYGADIEAPITAEEPAPGDTPYLKAPDADVWLRIVPKHPE